LDYTNILIKIRRIIRSINLESKKIQKEYGISIPQILCLNYLLSCKDYISTHNDIKNILILNSSTVTGIINRLEKKGFLARLPKSGDKRISKIALTLTGKKLISQIPPLLHEQLSKKLINLPDNQINEIENSLDLLINLLEIEEVEASPLITVEANIMPEE